MDGKLADRARYADGQPSARVVFSEQDVGQRVTALETGLPRVEDCRNAVRREVDGQRSPCDHDENDVATNRRNGANKIALTRRQVERADAVCLTRTARMLSHHEHHGVRRACVVHDLVCAQPGRDQLCLGRDRGADPVQHRHDILLHRVGRPAPVQLFAALDVGTDYREALD